MQFHTLLKLLLLFLTIGVIKTKETPRTRTKLLTTRPRRSDMPRQSPYNSPYNPPPPMYNSPPVYNPPPLYKMNQMNFNHYRFVPNYYDITPRYYNPSDQHFIYNQPNYQYFDHNQPNNYNYPQQNPYYFNNNYPPAYSNQINPLYNQGLFPFLGHNFLAMSPPPPPPPNYNFNQFSNARSPYHPPQYDVMHENERFKYDDYFIPENYHHEPPRGSYQYPRDEVMRGEKIKDEVVKGGEEERKKEKDE